MGVLKPATGEAMRADAIFRIYSMTKPLVSVAAMTLIEQGKVQLNDPVSKFLPSMKSLQVSVAKADAEFAKVGYTLVPADRDMTVQDLLRHSAGLAYSNLSQNAAVKDAYVKNGIEGDFRALEPDRRNRKRPGFSSNTTCTASRSTGTRCTSSRKTARTPGAAARSSAPSRSGRAM